jgi:hypothetical protein
MPSTWAKTFSQQLVEASAPYTSPDSRGTTNRGRPRSSRPGTLSPPLQAACMLHGGPFQGPRLSSPVSLQRALDPIGMLFVVLAVQISLMSEIQAIGNRP